MLESRAVMYNGATDSEVNFGSNDDPRGVLTVGACYRIESIDVTSIHVRVRLFGFNGWFNSVSFSYNQTTPIIDLTEREQKTVELLDEIIEEANKGNDEACEEIIKLDDSGNVRWSAYYQSQVAIINAFYLTARNAEIELAKLGLPLKEKREEQKGEN